MSNRAWQEQAAARSSQRRSVDAGTHCSSPQVVPSAGMPRPIRPERDVPFHVGSVSIHRVFEGARQAGRYEGASLLDDRQKDTGVKILRRRHGILDLTNARIEV